MNARRCSYPLSRWESVRVSYPLSLRERVRVRAAA
jgi:hypothetical protein